MIAHIFAYLHRAPAALNVMFRHRKTLRAFSRAMLLLHAIRHRASAPPHRTYHRIFAPIRARAYLTRLCCLRTLRFGTPARTAPSRTSAGGGMRHRRQQSA